MLELPSFLTAERAELASEIREWIAEHPEPSARELAHEGFVVPHWPPPWGRDADVLTRLVIDAEFARARVPIPRNAFATKWVGPSIVVAGTPTQKERYLWPMLAGEELWCRLHSEPDAGTDLSLVATRAIERDGTFTITGQKVWAAQASTAHFAAVLARTSGTRGDGGGLSYVIVPMAAPGVTVRPIEDFAGGTVTSEVFLDEVVVPTENLIGERGQGLRLRLTDLGRSRATAAFGVLLGNGPTAVELTTILDSHVVDPVTKHDFVERYLETLCLDALTILDVLEESATGERLHALREEYRELLLQRHGRASFELVHRLKNAGADGVDEHVAAVLALPVFREPIVRAPFLTIMGGTLEMHQEAVAALLYGDIERATAVRF